MTKYKNFAIIDDDETTQFIVEITIDNTNLAKNIAVFSDGKEAIDFFILNLNNPENLPDIIFLDLNMPIMDGWQFLDHFEILKPQIGKKITICITSSSTNQTDIIRAKKYCDVTEYIIKPITEEDVIRLHQLI
jgi:CheY-like chemotaxis protein